MTILKPELKNSILLVLLMVIAFSIPFHNTFSSISIALLVLFWVIESSPGAKLKRMLQPAGSHYVIGFSLIFLVYLIGTLYSDGLFTRHSTLFVIQVKASLIIFPVLFSTLDADRFTRKFQKRIFVVFVIGCLLSSVILLGNAVYLYLTDDQDISVFYYMKLARHHHPSYLALIYAMALAVLLNAYFRKETSAFRAKWLLLMLLLYFQIFIVALSSKAGIIALVILYAGLVLFVALRKSTLISNAIIFSGGMLVVMVILVAANPKVAERFVAMGEAISANWQETNADTVESSLGRLLIWESAIEVLSRHPVLGVGTGDVRDELMKKYHEKELKPAIRMKSNAHSQYLQIYLAAGIPGLLILLACFAAGLYVSLKYNNLLYFLFILLFSFHVLVESMFERQAGVVFFSFFNSLLFIFSFRNKHETDKRLKDKQWDIS